MSDSFILDATDPAGTAAFGHRLATLLESGSVVALVGPLGSGKTHLARAIAEGLGVPDSRVVTSPTFVLIQEYEGRLPIYHFDAYRLPSAAAFHDLGAHEYLAGNGVCLVEWADRVQSCLPPDHLRVTLAITGSTARRLVVEGLGAGSQEIVRRLRS